jgi:hypothetical protein
MQTVKAGAFLKFFIGNSSKCGLKNRQSFCAMAALGKGDASFQTRAWRRRSFGLTKTRGGTKKSAYDSAREQLQHCTIICGIVVPEAWKSAKQCSKNATLNTSTHA